jgi:hypothetical protein
MEVAHLIPGCVVTVSCNVLVHRDHPEVLVGEQSPEYRYFMTNAVGDAPFFVICENSMCKTAHWDVVRAPVRAHEPFAVSVVDR